MRVIGIDPGRKGAIAVLKENRKIVECIEMPTKRDPAGKETQRSIDFHQLYAFLGKFQHEKPIVIIEKVRAIKGSAAMSTFKFGRNYQAVVDAAEVWKYPIRYVEAKYWQDHFFGETVWKPKKKGRYGKLKNDTKAMALIAARKIWRSKGTQEEHFYPNYKVEMGDRAVPHDGKVDALLIAYWGIKNVLEKGLHPYGPVAVKTPTLFKSEEHTSIFKGFRPEE